MNSTQTPSLVSLGQCACICGCGTLIFRKACDELRVSPVLILNRIEYFDESDLDAIAAHVQALQAEQQQRTRKAAKNA